MSISTILAAVFTSTVPQAPVMAPQPGTAFFERKDAQCAAYYDPKLPPTKDTEPYRGEHMLKPIGTREETIQNVMRFPPGFPLASAPANFKVTAEGEIEVGPTGDVVRVRLTSPEDGRFAAHGVGAIAFWRYQLVPTGKLCRKIPFSAEWKIEG
jgi:hypothetical protein